MSKQTPTQPVTTGKEFYESADKVITMSKKENKKVDFYDVPANEWQMPILKGYKMACCDCCLVHNMTFKIIDPDTNKVIKNARVIMKATRHETLTKQLRKERNIEMLKEYE